MYKYVYLSSVYIDKIDYYLGKMFIYCDLLLDGKSKCYFSRYFENNVYYIL